MPDGWTCRSGLGRPKMCELLVEGALEDTVPGGSGRLLNVSMGWDEPSRVGVGVV